MKKIREYTEFDPISEVDIVYEEYELTIDDIVEGIPEPIKEPVGRRYRKLFNEWGKQIILEKVKDEPLFNIVFYCKNDAKISTDVYQKDITPGDIATAYGQCLEILEYCIYWYGKQREAEKKRKIIPFKR